MKILAILGEGGHTKEMVALIDQLGDGIEYAYLVVRDDEVSASKIRVPGPVYRVQRPRDKKHMLLLDIWKTLLCGVQSARALVSFRPTAIITAGPSVAVPGCIVARCLGIRVIFVETGSRVTALSMTGRLVYPWAHLFFVQWPELASRYPKAVYAGRLF